MGWSVSLGITEEQQRALNALRSILPTDAYLAGGVAVALRFHHRLSRDLDLFVPSGNPEKLADRLGSLDRPAKVISRADGTLHAEVDGVPISILRYAYQSLNAPERLSPVDVPVASTADLACMKLSAIAGRGAKRDFWDLHVLVSTFERGLTDVLALYQKKFPIEDVGHVVRSLVYFADAEAEPPIPGLSPDRWKTIKADFQRWVSAL
jgi:hypothetical protein